MKKSRKVIALLLALIISVSAFGAVVSAEDDAPYNRYVSVVPGSPSPKGTSSKPWGIDYLKEDAFAQAINDKIQSGSYTSVVINIMSSEDYDAPLIIKGVEGTKDVPVYVVGNYLAGGEGNDSVITPAGGAEYGIAVEDCSYVNISNLKICNANMGGALGGGINVINSNNITFQNISSYKPNQNYKKTMTNAVTIGDGVSNIVFEGCSFTHTEKAFEIVKSEEPEAKGITGLTISNCSSEYCASQALLISGINDVAINNFSAVRAFYVEEEEDQGVETGKEYIDEPAVVLDNIEGLTFSDAEILECPGPALSLRNVKSAVVEKVFSENNAAFMVNTLANDCNIVIRYCISANDNGKTSVASLTNAGGVCFINNTIYNIGEFDFGKLSSSVIKNNIFQTVMFGKINVGSNDCSNNCYWNTSKPSGDSKSMMKNPQFFDTVTSTPSKGEFVLADNSVLIAAGTKVDGFMGTEDIFDNEITGKESFNIGAYQGAGVTPVVEIDQTREIIQYYFSYFTEKIKQAFDNFLSLFLTPEQKQSISDWFTNTFSGIISKIAEIIGSFTG